MTSREGETFPGFFYGRRGQPDAGVWEVRSSQEEGDGLECRHWEFAAIYGLEEVAAREARRRFCGAVVGDVRKDRAVDALRGPHSGIACSGTFFGGAVCCLKKCKQFSVSFRYVD